MDAVILYVNSNDKEWLDEYRSQNLPPIHAERYRDWGTLPYLLRGIDLYLPFIENVFLVVSRESQVPYWVDTKKVHIVYHKDIIPKEYLPTYNSCVIETHIPYIKGLSEEFVYFNDDMFPINPCAPELFFKDGRPQDWLRVRTIREQPVNVYRYQCLNSTNYARKALGIKESGEYMFPVHWPHPLLKSKCLEILEKMGRAYREQVTPLRGIENVNQYLFLDYMYFSGVLDNVDLPYTYLSQGKRSASDVALQIREGEGKIICINDSGNIDDANQYQKIVLDAFKSKFPNKCKYERGFYKDSDVIVSMASYPARIHCVAKVWESVLKQDVSETFRCVLVLVESEFEGKSLPSELQYMVDSGVVELLWCKEPIRSHSKLMPVIKKYPEAAIITIDDDMTKPKGWLQNLIDDHKRWPNDIISDSFTYYLDSNMQWGRMLDLKQKVSRGKNDVAGLVFNFARFCSGHGTLFPAHTFTDERFFDWKKAMEIAPTCDETWMWCFAVLSGRNCRQVSKIYDESAYTIDGTQKMPTALYKANRLVYDQMYEALFKEYPEFKARILEGQRKYVIATENIDEAREKNPYHAVITTDDKSKIEVLLKMYWDKPNRIAKVEGGRLYPPSYKT